MKYYVFEFTEDGDIYINEYTKAGLEKVMQEEWYEDDIDPTYYPKYLKNTDFRPEETIGHLIIKGEIVIPKAVEVVKRMEIQ